MPSEADTLRGRLLAAQGQARRLMARAQALARHSVALKLTADASAPGVARDTVACLAAAAGVSTVEVEAVKTAVSEAVCNAVMHAYDGGEAGLVYVDAYVLGGVLTVLVADDGRGPRVPSPNPGLGLGWKVIMQLCDKCAITRRGGGGTLIYMRFRLGHRRLVDVPAAWV
jgi:anti-sigma regulatory factor (Ser/Thr protein kinase)